MEPPIANYKYKSKCGMTFFVGDSELEKCFASVFVEGHSPKFIEKVTVGQALKYSNAHAKYDGKGLWIDLLMKSF